MYHSESRRYIRYITHKRVPIQIKMPLCLKDNKGYISLAKILTHDFVEQDIINLHDFLCEINIQHDWLSLVHALLCLMIFLTCGKILLFT